MSNVFLRSQGKTKLLELTGIVVEIKAQTDNPENSGRYHHIFARWVNNSVTAGKFLGGYSSQEKAIAVVDAIQEFIDNKRYSEIVPQQCGYISGAVYQMPKDEDVQV